LGYDTPTALRSGVVRGIAHEVSGYIRQMRSPEPQLVVLLTGGDAALIASQLTEPVEVVSDLVLIGLKYILDYNVLQ
jgi:type III pantothenate kinase